MRTSNRLPFACSLLLPKNVRHFRGPRITMWRNGNRLFFSGADDGSRSAVSWAPLAVPLSRRGGRTQTQLPSLPRPFDPLTNLNKKRSSLFNFLRSGADDGSRTHTSFRTQDFKSCASAIPPHRQNFGGTTRIRTGE